MANDATAAGLIKAADALLRMKAYATSRRYSAAIQKKEGLPHTRNEAAQVQKPCQLDGGKGECQLTAPP